jgi:hypothetical protein
MSGLKAPSSNIQAPEKFHAPNFKSAYERVWPKEKADPSDIWQRATGVIGS